MARTNRLGFEEYDNTDVSDELALVEDPSDTVEAHLVDIERDATADAVAAVDIDQLDNDMIDMVGHARIVEDSMDQGGMDPIAARSTEIAVESVCNRWNIKRKTVGFESFRDSGEDRMTATRVAFEGIVDTVKEGAKTAWRWILAKIDQIKQAWMKFQNAGKSAKKRIEKLRSRVQNLRGAKESGETIEGKKIYKLATSKAQISQITKMSDDTLTAAVGKIADIASAAIDDATQVVSQVGTDVNININGKAVTLADLGTSLVWTISGSERKFGALVPPRATDVKMGLTYGGVVITYTNSDGAPCLTYQEMSLEQVDEFEAEVLDPKAMTDLLDVAFNTAAGLDQYYRSMSKVDGKLRKLKDAIGKASSKHEKAFDKKNASSESTDTTRKAYWLAKAKFETAVEVERMYRRCSVNFIQGACAYVTESMKKYSVED